MGKKDKKNKEEADAAAAGDAPPTDGAPAGEGGDGEIVGGPRNPQQIAAQKRLQQTQAQVDEVVDIMRTNVEKVLERDQKLSELDDRADALQQGASQFEQQAGKLKRKFWLQNLKMMIIMGVIGLVIVGIIANKLGLIGGEQPPQYPQYPQYMPPPPPQQAQPAAGGQPALVDDGVGAGKAHEGGV
ncbi:vesicle-associated membrane protein 2 isoform X1 [Scaptodrosophila lebanonensis]|uniref:Vesicle-associated membrane protein 2 isoform X1 n=1 Tax=Drosophila lebanonensis TaxID=7225 RepID=A0A6J2TZ86_DROLE|nr:vesicle-associated membrane protein 2 isoform X1 [Scaptodrosophila lebanonensis]